MRYTKAKATRTAEQGAENRLDPLLNRALSIALAAPESVVSDVTSWHGHVPFAQALVAIARPRLVVELGVHRSGSYLAMVDAMGRYGVNGRAFGIDSWQGHELAKSYDGDAILQDVTVRNAPFAEFSSLVQRTFDEALADFEDGTVDLLHIDGFHTYEAVRHDFESWRPKLSDRGIVLFHNTAVRTEDFGVYRFWDEVSAGRTSYAFEHSNGLGVLCAGDHVASEAQELIALLREPHDNGIAPAMLFRTVGEAFAGRTETRVFRKMYEAKQAEAEAIQRAAMTEIEAKDEQIERLDATTKAKDEQIKVLSAEIAKRERRLILARDHFAGVARERQDQIERLDAATKAFTTRLQFASANWQPPKSEYVPLVDASPVTNKPVRLIAFYLPQFHPIPENDEWWGEGFTEWTNVRAAQQQFVGHYQPHVPGELGYYDLLRDTKIQQRQIELAKLYGIEGFCFYFYWFAGKRLLERPLENWLQDPSRDLPFCLCWANENWSRRWDGLESEILIAQEHSPKDDLSFIQEVARYLRDPRYIRVDGKPLLLVYRPNLLPSAKQTAKRWRKWCGENGIGEIYLAYTQSFERIDPRHYGFDAAAEFPPNNSAPPNITEAVTPHRANFATNVYDWSIFPQSSENYQPREYKLFRSVCPSWDNTARRKNGGAAFVNNTPVLYRQWLENAIRDTLDQVEEPSERVIFVNAWNEWAEGAHLEPDTRYGYAWLQATRDAMEGAAARRIVVVSHDANAHGAQFLAMHMAREFGELGIATDLIVLGEGPLLPRFAEVATVHRLDLKTESEAAVVERLKKLRRNGADVAIVNTTVSGLLVPLLKQAGFQTVSLIHELPGVLKSYGLERHAAAIAEHAAKVVFAAQIVRDGFEGYTGQTLRQAVIRPQGVLRSNPFKGRHEEARRAICERHGFPPETRFILSVAFVDDRKGPDLFVEAAEEILATHRETAFIWVGHSDRNMQEKVDALIEAKGLCERIRFVGFVAEPLDYYAAASVYALTSREDPFPNVVLESAEVGVPVVAFEGATGAADFIIEQGGRLARSFDPNDFAAQVGELLDAPARADRAPVGSLRQYLLDILHLATGVPRAWRNAPEPVGIHDGACRVRQNIH